MPLLHFSPTYDEGCEDATELPLQNVLANENELLKKETKSDHTRAVQKVAFLNCGHPSTADPDKNSAVSDFFCCTVIAWYRADARYANVLSYWKQHVQCQFSRGRRGDICCS